MNLFHFQTTVDTLPAIPEAAIMASAISNLAKPSCAALWAFSLQSSHWMQALSEKVTTYIIVVCDTG